MATSSASSSHHKERHHHVQTGHHDPVAVPQASSSAQAGASGTTVVSRKTLQTLTKVVDPNVQLDEETEDMLLGYSDEFLEKVIEGACNLAAHRKATSLDVADVEMYLERHCNMWLSSDPNKEEPLKATKKIAPAEAHRQRVALIKKTMKKY